MPLALTQGASERYSLIFRVCKTYIPIDAATAAKVNSDQYCFVSKAQVAAGTPRPDAETLRAAAEADANAAAARDAAAGRQWPEVSRKAHNAAAKAAASPPVPQAVAPVAPEAAPHALAPPPATTSASRKRKAGAASGDAPMQPLPLASPPTPEEATQRLRDALESGDEGAAALALETLEAVAMTKDTLRSTGAMSLPNAHASMPPPRHLVPNRRGQGRQ